jgi:hypothetical protein
MRIPRMIGLPPKIAGSAVIRSSGTSSILLALRHPAFGPDGLGVPVTNMPVRVSDRLGGIAERFGNVFPLQIGITVNWPRCKGRGLA